MRALPFRRGLYSMMNEKPDNVLLNGDSKTHQVIWQVGTKKTAYPFGSAVSVFIGSIC